MTILPQSGTSVASTDIIVLDGLISNVLKIETDDFASLIEMRVLLEIESAKLAADRRTNQDIEDIRKTLEAYREKVKLNQKAVEEDLMFHLKIAEASKNAVLKSFMSIITPEIIDYFLELGICKDEYASTILKEHEVILKHIIAQEPEKAASAMRKHLKGILDYSQRLKNRLGN